MTEVRHGRTDGERPESRATGWLPGAWRAVDNRSLFQSKSGKGTKRRFDLALDTASYSIGL